MNYLVIDLEMCKVPKNYRNKNYKYANEIIQIGAVLLDEQYKRIGTLSQYVHPEHGVVDHFITNLTGIENNQVKHAPKLRETLIHMLDWLGDRQYQIFAWSENDYLQLSHEIKSKNLDDEEIQNFMKKERWIDYQKVFGTRFEIGRAVSLEEALLLCDIDPEGKLHDGLDDAWNTAKIIEELELNPDFQLISEEQQEVNSQPLKINLGELFSGLNIKFA